VWLDGPGESRVFADRIARIVVRNGIATVRGPCGEVEVAARGFDVIEAALEAWRGTDAVLSGYLGYELGCELESVAVAQPGPVDLPDLDLGLYADSERAPDWAGESPAPLTPALGSTPTEEGFREAVARTVRRIYEGELFQVNLCRRLEGALDAGQILSLYHRLRAISPATHGALLCPDEGTAILSVSPELFLSVRNGRVRSCPIKGTRPRGRTAEEDAVLAAALASSEKDRAELAMIVDVTRNDLGRVCRAGSVQVTRHAELMTLPTVHHTYSEVLGELRPECGVADLLRASFPPASITGAPKIHAMELAAREEGFRRGPCMGSIGWISMDGDLELSVAIRTAVASKGRVWYLAGCGITADSDPEEELAESEAKAAAFRRALGLNELAREGDH
jgi:para-aminobenzoate synthetase component 1